MKILFQGAKRYFTPLEKQNSLTGLTRQHMYNIGWVTYNSPPNISGYIADANSTEQMRPGQIIRWVNSNARNFYNEFYRPDKCYDAVVFVKVMDEVCQQEVRKIKDYGGKIIFDANVNYYRIWGDYPVPGTKPTIQQQQQAVWMTTNSDWVVADSSYLFNLCKEYTPCVTWIPDNIDLKLFQYKKRHIQKIPVTLVWSGVAKKAYHLELIKDVLAELKDIHLLLITNEGKDNVLPKVVYWLKERMPVTIIPFDYNGFPRQLLKGDIYLSPKIINNGYECGHTEYKITVGMAQGLPVVASPQQSYIEAISYKGGGFIVDTKEEWFGALNRLIQNSSLRVKMGSLARQAVEEKYSTAVVAKQYLGVLENILKGCG